MATDLHGWEERTSFAGLAYSPTIACAARGQFYPFSSVPIRGSQFQFFDHGWPRIYTDGRRGRVSRGWRIRPPSPVRRGGSFIRFHPCPSVVPSSNSLTTDGHGFTRMGGEDEFRGVGVFAHHRLCGEGAVLSVFIRAHPWFPVPIL